MLKDNAQQAMDRWLAFHARQMQDQILVTFVPPSNSPAGILGMNDQDDPADQEWRERPCRSEVDMERIIADARQQAETGRRLPDDSLPRVNPTGYFGEGIAGALLGGSVRFMGNAHHTCSRSEPLIRDWDDLHRLTLDKNSTWAQRYRAAMRRATELDRDDLFFVGFVVLDALNLAMELRGHTQACLDIHQDPGHLRELMQFGVEFGVWFHEMEQEIIAPHNQAVTGGHPYARIAPFLPWTSIDGYLICHPRVYAEMGQAYHADFLTRVGGGTIHTHGENIIQFLPMLAELPNLSWLQVGTDLNDGSILPLLDHLPEIRRITGDIPLIDNYLGAEDFTRALRDHCLVGGAQYIVAWPNNDLDDMQRCMDQVLAYRWHG